MDINLEMALKIVEETDDKRLISLELKVLELLEDVIEKKEVQSTEAMLDLKEKVKEKLIQYTYRNPYIPDAYYAKQLLSALYCAEQTHPFIFKDLSDNTASEIQRQNIAEHMPIDFWCARKAIRMAYAYRSGWQCGRMMVYIHAYMKMYENDMSLSEDFLYKGWTVSKQYTQSEFYEFVRKQVVNSQSEKGQSLYEHLEELREDGTIEQFMDQFGVTFDDEEFIFSQGLEKAVKRTYEEQGYDYGETIYKD